MVSRSASRDSSRSGTAVWSARFTLWNLDSVAEQDAWRILRFCLQRPQTQGGTHLCQRHASLLGARRGFGVLGSCRASPVAVVMEAPAGGEPRPENSHPSSAFGATLETLCFAWEGTPTGWDRGCSRCRLLGDKQKKNKLEFLIPGENSGQRPAGGAHLHVSWGSVEDGAAGWVREGEL